MPTVKVSVRSFIDAHPKAFQACGGKARAAPGIASAGGIRIPSPGFGRC